MKSANVTAGQRFGRLVLVEPCGNVGGRPAWRCRCDCGVVTELQRKRLVSGHTQSCGCLKADGNATKHGNRRRGHTSPTYVSWSSMVQRCTDPDHDSYAGYGGSGITLCDRWKSFACFLEDMGDRPFGTTIDRIDGAKGYEPDNCRWATDAEQANNKKTNLNLTLNGRTLSVAQWAAETGISESCIRTRIGRLNWGTERALSTAPRKGSHV